MEKKRLGERIKELREVNNLTQKDLAEKLFVSDKVISKWENSISEPDVDTLVKLSEIFNTSLEFLMTGNISTRENKTVSRMELACREDNIALIGDIDINEFDEQGKNIEWYANYYNAKRIQEFLRSLKLEEKIDDYTKRHENDVNYYICGYNKNDSPLENIKFIKATRDRSEITKFCQEAEKNGWHKFEVYHKTLDSSYCYQDFECLSMHIVNKDGKPQIYISWQLLDNDSAIIEVKLHDVESRHMFFASAGIMREMICVLHEIDIINWENKPCGYPICHIMYLLEGELTNDDDVQGFFYVTPDKDVYLYFVKALKELMFKVMDSLSYKRFISLFNDDLEPYYRYGENSDCTKRIFKAIEEENEIMKKRNIERSNNKWGREDELLRKYLEMFDELPPLLMSFSYNHPIYLKLMKQAIENNEPITAQKVEQEIEKNGIKYDVD